MSSGIKIILMKKVIILLFFCPFFVIAQDVLIHVPEVNFTEKRSNLHQIGSQQWTIDTILTKNSYSLSDLLRQFGPIYVKEYGALSSSFFRGTTASHTQLLWNGIPLNSLSTGQADLSIFPTNIFSDVKLNVGGNSTLFGSGAIGGTIELNNTIETNLNYDGIINFTLGDFGLVSKSFFYQINNNNNSNLNFHFTKSKSENDFEYINTGLPENSVEIQEHAYKSSHQYLMNYIRRKDKFTSGFNLWISNNFREVPVGMLSSNPMAVQWDDAIRTKFFFFRNITNYSLKLTHAFSTENFEYQSNTIRSHLRTIHHFSSLNINRTFKKLVTHFGLNFQNRSVYSNYYSEIAIENLLAYFISSKYQLNRFTTTASFRKEVHPIYPVPLLYSYGHNFNISSNFIWKLQVAKNFRAPSFNDLYWLGDGAMGNTDLLPELALNSETTLEYKRASVTLFSNVVDNMIYWQPNSELVWVPQNLKQVWSRGSELKYDYKNKIGKVNLISQFSYAYTISKINKSDIENDNSIDKQLAYVPIHKASCLINLDFNKWKFSLINSFNGKVFTTSDEGSELASYFISDLIINYQLNFHSASFDIKINNFLNKSYQVYEWFPMPARHLITSFNFKF